MSDFKKIWDEKAKDAYFMAKSKGFWPGQPNPGEKVALIHSEVSEVLEALRKKPMGLDAKIPEFLEVEAELADVVIRLMDFSAHYGYDVAGAIEAKMAYNATRPHKHGKEF